MSENSAVESVRLVKSFFRDLYGDCVGVSGSIVMWSKAKGVSTIWKDELDVAADVAVARATRVDSYFQPCLHDKDLVLAETDKRIAAGKKKRDGSPLTRTMDDKRGYNQSASLMPGLWVDIDTKEGEHETDWDGLPESAAKVISVLRNLDAPPTFIIDTGGGVHAYWLFTEPMDLVTDEDRVNATDLNYRWQQGYLRGQFEKHGWTTLDSTYDLTRVMRVPGTLNRKYSPPRRVRLLGAAAKRYEPDEFEMYIPDNIGGAPKKSTVQVGIEGIPTEFTCSDIIETICGFDNSFRLIWNGRRIYQSQSNRDLAIASVLANRQIGPDVILNAIVHNRRMMGAKRTPEDKQIGYYETTIAKAMEKSRIEFQEQECLEDIQREIEDNKAEMKMGSQQAHDVRAGLLSRIGSMLGLDSGRSLIAIECVSPGGGQARTYTLKTSHGSRILGDISGIRSQQKFMDALADVFIVATDQMPTKKWKQMYGLLMQLVDEVDLGEESTEEGQTRALLRRWMEVVCPTNGIRESRRHVCVENGLPWIKDNRVHLCPSACYDRISRLIPNSKLTLHKLTSRIRGIGGAKTVSRAKLPEDEKGHRKTYDMWQLPNEVGYWLPDEG